MSTKKATNTRTPRSKLTTKKAPKRQGNLKPGSRSTIAYNARLAFDCQDSMGNIETGVTFDQWRHDQVMRAVNRPGVSACDGHHYKPLMVHFLVLANREDEALQYGFKTGKVTDHGDPNDTHEAREQWVALIRNEVAAHIALADTPEAEVLPGDQVIWKAIQDHGGPIRLGYVSAVAANKFLDRDRGSLDEDGNYIPPPAGRKSHHTNVRFDSLVDRLPALQLEQLFYTVRNRIAAKEGRGDRETRNKKQSSEQAKAARKAAKDPGTLSDRDVPI